MSEGNVQPAPARRPIVAGNWKMHFGPSEAGDFVVSILDRLVAAAASGVEVVLCPPAISIPAVRMAVGGSGGIQVGAQNMYFEAKGAYTGEISPPMLQGLCEYVILGHSERRMYFGETDDLVNRKTLAAFAHGLRPIVCVGERLEDRDASLTERVISAQVRASLADLPVDRLDGLVVAYEPVWAIGTGRAATVQDASDAAALIRALLADMNGVEASAGVRILYGGSVTEANAGDFAALADIDGALVGGASLKREFVAIVAATAQAKGLAAEE